MNKKLNQQADYLYLVLSALFIASLVTTNLIANKFVTVDLGFKEFVVSAGMLPYPITFLITDILSEIYGKKKTTNVVIAGFFASMLVLFALWLGSVFPAIDQSPVSDEVYNQVFANSYRVVFSSMTAYLIAQFADLKLYHFWKKLTNGKHLWLRNNGSTIVSQLLDTTLVVGVLFLGQMTFTEMSGLIKDGWLFKILFALIDTPLLYLAIYLIRKKFHLKSNQELS
ncbi:MAG: putative integral membrane protein (TIGR00697 family) [Salibacteraceae bacterium]|jgi:uncharacterized integral membrane protein (TIGR00697 family)